jgi:hypothetical protein
MNMKNWEYKPVTPVPKPPLGPKPDFNEVTEADKELKSRCLDLEFTPLEDHPRLMSYFFSLSEELNSLRRKHGAPELQISTKHVRLVNKDVYGTVRDYMHDTKGCSNAVYDYETDTCFIEYDYEKYSTYISERVTILYAIAHELGHKSLLSGKLSLYSFHLDEGLADYMAKITLEGVFPKILTEEQLAS